jgi:hypothetical protein
MNPTATPSEFEWRDTPVSRQAERGDVIYVEYALWGLRQQNGDIEPLFCAHPDADLSPGLLESVLLLPQVATWQYILTSRERKRNG